MAGNSAVTGSGLTCLCGMITWALFRGLTASGTQAFVINFYAPAPNRRGH